MSTVTAIKKSKLKAVDPKAAEPSKPKILIFGDPGVGKTWTSLEFPNCYFIDTEGGATRDHYTDRLKKSGGVYMGPEQGSLDFDVVIEQIQALATEKHSYKTVIIDSFTKLYNTCAAEAAEKGGDDFGRDKKEANKPTRKLINWLGRLDMNVILIAHQKAKWGQDAKGNRVESGVTYDAYEKLAYELDLTMNIIKAGPNRLAKIQKSRLIGFPEGETLPWSYQEFAKRYGVEVIEKASNQLVLAKPEQVAEITSLLEVVKLPPGETERWLKHAGVESWTEMDEDKIVKCIAALKEKLPK